MRMLLGKVNRRCARYPTLDGTRKSATKRILLRAASAFVSFFRRLGTDRQRCNRSTGRQFDLGSIPRSGYVDSPGLPRFAATLGSNVLTISNPNGVASFL